jgi:Carboxypeptidase regulatory-like domain
MKVIKVFCLAVLAMALISAMPGFAQSITSGDIAGVLTDPSGAVVPNAKVTATNDATGEVHSATTNGEGAYRFPFLKPGAYALATSATGFQPSARKVSVTVGETVNGNFVLAVTGANTTVEVSAPLTQIDSGDTTTSFSEQQISLVPNPGNDLSAIAQTSPGVIMNTQSGFGNFSSFGLPGTSNLFTLDGQNDNDPFLNLNNSGATNLLLGSNEVGEATVVQNGYSGQYGQLAGAQVNYVTKSGGNQFHGNAIYQWNGRALNANDFVNNETGTPRTFDNVNQWAASIGGPIVKDKTFFFWDYEGLRVVLPTSNAAFLPTTAFQQATLQATANASTRQFYQTIFNLYNNAPGAGRATAQAPSQDCLNAAAAFQQLAPASASTVFPSGTPCVNSFRSTAGNFTHEYLTALRIDHKFSENDSIFGRVQTDQGVQATLTDVINPLFNTQSTQPEYQGQLGWTHLVNSNQVNEFKVSGQWYSAVFTQANPAATLAAFPTTLALGDGAFSALGGGLGAASFIPQGQQFPQGRNVAQYQVVDDYSWNRGKQTWKFGVNFHRNDVTDFNPQILSNGLVTVNTLADFLAGGNASNIPIPNPNFDPTQPVSAANPKTIAAGSGNNLNQNFATRLSQPIAVYGLGVYGQNEWAVSKKLKLTLALRVDHNSNPVCQTDCFARLAVPFTQLNLTGPASATTPYSQFIETGLHQAYPSTDIVVWQPRLGFAYSPTSDNKTVIRGGIGIFSDSFPATVADTLLNNPPTLASFNVVNGLIAAPGVKGSNFFVAGQRDQAFTQSFNTPNGTAANLGLTGAAAPAITSTDAKVRQPRYYEWNLEIQRELPWNNVLSVNYVGNHGSLEAVQNSGLNGFSPTGFAGLPTSAPNQALGVVNQIQSIGSSNFDGLVASLRHSFTHGIQFQVNYQWSHSLDDVSNGGLLPFNADTNVSPLNPNNPFSVRSNYGNSDYDVRHYFSLNYVWDDSLRHLFHWGPNVVFSGWTVSGTLFARSGLPFTVVDQALSAELHQTNFAPTYSAFATPVAGVSPFIPGRSCGSGDATAFTCLNNTAFSAPTTETGFGNQGRNGFRGPDFFDTDLSVLKYTKITEGTKIGLGLQFFNLLNHPNFDQPVNDISNPNFGVIQRTVNTPTSILGSFLGGDASPRLIQLKAELKF